MPYNNIDPKIIKYVIFNKEGLFWNNDLGWSNLSLATRFTLEERNRVSLPIGGYWMKTFGNGLKNTLPRS